MPSLHGQPIKNQSYLERISSARFAEGKLISRRESTPGNVVRDPSSACLELGEGQALALQEEVD